MGTHHTWYPLARVPIDAGTHWRGYALARFHIGTSTHRRGYKLLQGGYAPLERRLRGWGGILVFRLGTFRGGEVLDYGADTLWCG